MALCNSMYKLAGRRYMYNLSHEEAMRSTAFHEVV